ncbi:MAG TPA: HD domain-containing phosphohydrolase [Gemmatimonadaceae bacterium]|nr:HD domain-containing phosphohydrolase [Gemmatimonadaceae bacterium]
MITPQPFAALRKEVATLVEQGRRADLDGDRALARSSYERAIRALRRDEAEFVPSLIRRIARSYIDDGLFDAALDCLAAAQHLSRARGDTSGVAHAVNQMATANLQRGDLESAEALYHKAQALAETANDAPLEAMVAQNLGIVAGLRGNPDASLGHYQQSLCAYRDLELHDYIGPVLNNMAMAYASLKRWAEADRCYQDALAETRKTGNRAAGRMIEVNRIDMWLLRGEVARAAAAARAVFEEATAAGDQRALGEISKHLGAITRIRGEYEESERWLDAAYASAMRREDLLLAAETAREQAELFELLGRNRETLRVLGLSHRLFTRLKAKRNLADLAARVERLETRFFDIVHRWAQNIESKDPYTLGHCERVAEYACALAREAGLEDLTMFWFRIGALLHDVGKIEVPTHILTKSGPLTEEERALMERHAAAGADLLRDIEFPWDVLPMIRGHHERWDGRGYPDRLAGEEIPLTARVLCIADVFDALASDRPYRPAFPRDEALEIMRRDVGRAFDPQLFEHFLKVVMRPGIAMEAAQRPRAAGSREA